MKTETLKQRLSRDRPRTSLVLRIPEDVVEDLKRVAPLRGFSNYQPLIRTYIGQGLRADLERLEDTPVARLIEELRRQGVSEQTIDRALESLKDRDS